MQTKKHNSIDNLFYDFLIIYIGLSFVLAIVFAYLGITFLSFNNSITFAISVILYMEFYEPKFMKIVNFWVLISGTYNIICDVIIFGWGYGFELYLIAFISVIHFSVIKNKYFESLFMALLTLVYLFLYFYSKDMDIVYGDILMKHIIYIVNFLNIILAFLFLYKNLNSPIISNAISIERSKKKYKKISEQDFLTGLLTRAPMQTFINDKIQILKDRKLKSICVILSDLDNFKNINDTYGHIFGDKVLTSVANSLKKSFSNYGKLSRWGGEEFLIILENIDISQAKEILEKARSDIENLNIDGISVSSTFGAVYLDRFLEDLNIEKVVDMADKLMYKGKEEGKNRVVFKNY